jgi:hypothetical protein
MKRAITWPLVIAAIAIVIGAIDAIQNPARALFAYAIGFNAIVFVAVAALLFVMIAHTARARWFVVLRPITSSIASTLPVFAILIIPILIGTHSIFPWARADLDAEDRAWVTHAGLWFDPLFFAIRSIAYIAIWSVIAHILARESNVVRERWVSAAMLPVVALTSTFAAFDWIMSLNARWVSDMIGVYVFAGGFSGAIGATAVLAWLAHRSGILPREVGAAHFHALGRVLLVTVIFWAYIAFCQLLLVWIANEPREASFYADRVRAGWSTTSAVLGVTHFAVPFLALLSRNLKEKPGRLALVGAWLFAAHILDTTWLIIPASGHSWRVVDLAFPIAFTSLAFAYGAWRLTRFALPTNDPSLRESLAYESP